MQFPRVDCTPPATVDTRLGARSISLAELNSKYPADAVIYANQEDYDSSAELYIYIQGDPRPEEVAAFNERVRQQINMERWGASVPFEET